MVWPAAGALATIARFLRPGRRRLFSVAGGALRGVGRWEGCVVIRRPVCLELGPCDSDHRMWARGSAVAKDALTPARGAVLDSDPAVARTARQGPDDTWEDSGGRVSR